MQEHGDDTAISMTTSEFDNLMTAIVAGLFIVATSVYLGAGVFYLSDVGGVKQSLISGFITTSVSAGLLVVLGYRHGVFNVPEDGGWSVAYPDEEGGN